MKLIILDRDGVINFDSEHYIKDPSEWLPIPGSIEAIVKLKKLGYTVAVATNQSGIARGLYDEAILHSIHAKMQAELEKYQTAIDFIAYCPHHPTEQCLCRKPQAGMLEEISKYFNCDLTGAYFVGDSLCDVQAALSKNCIPILVKTGNGKATLLKLKNSSEMKVFENLLDFVNHLC